jgi:hypothetical protein
MGFHANLIGHRPGGHIDGRFLAQERRYSLLQAIDSRVFMKDIVPHLSLRHGCPHPWSGLRHSIATKINQWIRHFSAPKFNVITTGTTDG